MKKTFYLVLGLFMTGCGVCHSFGSCDYDSIGIGEPVRVLFERVGRPDQIANCGNGRRQYIYITHDNNPALQTKTVHRYIIVVENNVIVDKWTEDDNGDRNNILDQHSVMNEQMYREYD